MNGPVPHKPPPIRRVLPVLLVLAGAWWVWSVAFRSGDESNTAAREPLNVLLVTLDTTRADYLGCFGRATARTPNIDRIALEGARFTRCSTCTSLTAPAHGSIMTGTYPFVHGVRKNATHRLADANATLAERLKSIGYATRAVVAASVLNRRYGLDQGFDAYRDVPVQGHADNVIAERKGDRVCHDAIEALHAVSTGPFLLWVHFFDPHFPYESTRNAAAPTDRYEDEIAFMDAQIGRLTDEVRNLGVERKTLIVLVADHGEGLGQHGESFHGYFAYDTTLHVPLIFRSPGTIPSGRTIDARVRTIDIAPTILALLGAPPFENAQGVSLMPLIAGDVPDLELAAYAESMEGHLRFRLSPLRSLCAGGWKYVLAPNPELYHLDTDPAEEHNRIDEHPDLAAEMREQLRTLIAEAPPAPSAQESTVTLSPDQIAQLEALGYLGGAGTGGDGETRTELDIFEPRGGDPKDYAQALDLYSRSIWALSWRQFQRAEDLLRQVVEAMPQAALAYGDLAHVLQRQGKFDQASRLYEEALVMDPDYTHIRKMYAGLLVQSRRWPEATEQLTSILAKEPNDPKSRYNLGIALASLGRFDEARTHLERALAITPDDVRFLHAMGVLCIRENKLPEAADYFRKALKTDPTHAKSQNDLHRVLQMMRE